MQRPWMLMTAVALLGGCSLMAGEPDAKFAPECEEGARQACECPDGTAAFQHCGELDGGVRGFGGCECGARGEGGDESGDGEGEGEAAGEGEEREGPDGTECAGREGTDCCSAEGGCGEGEGEGEGEGGGEREGEGEGEGAGVGAGEGEGEGEGESGGEGEGESGGEGEGEGEGPGRLGQECFPNETCRRGLACRANLCIAAGGRGEICLEEDLCDAGLACVEAVCVPGGTDGLPCIQGACEDGLACVDGACTPGGDTGQPCLPGDDPCLPGLRCTDDRCVPAQGLDGEPCYANGTCDAPVVCVLEVCRARGAQGADCEEDGHCELGLECADGGQCALPDNFADCASACAAVDGRCDDGVGDLCLGLCSEEEAVLGCLADAVGDVCEPAAIWACVEAGCGSACRWLEDDAEPAGGCDLGYAQCLSDCESLGGPDTRSALAVCLAVAVRQECLADAVGDCAAQSCDGAAAECNPSHGLFCLDRRDFTRCERGGDFGYAACVDGNCAGVGCGAFGCNGGRQHFAPPEGGGDRFVVRDDGVVEDTQTNLMWEQATVAGVALAAADARCPALGLGGYDDWRLPDIFELFSLVDHGVQVPPLIDGAAFPGTVADRYWTTDGLPNDADNDERWRIDFNNGVVDQHDTPAQRAARCVRGRPVFHRYQRSGRYGLADPAVITDRLTGLSWEATAGGGQGRQTWNEARGRCSDLELGGEDDWRLPTIHELFTVVDTRVGAPSNAEPFDDRQNLPYWSLTSVPGVVETVYALQQGNGTVNHRGKNNGTTSRCVRRQ